MTTHRTLPAVVSSDADVERFWRVAMEPLGFSQPAAWFTLLVDDAPSGVLVEITELRDRPDEAEVEGFARFLDGVVADVAGTVRLAVLLVRPGYGGPTSQDIGRARAFVASARRAGVPLAPLHLATDVALVPLAPDVLIE